jgi:hypothetical protein
MNHGESKSGSGKWKRVLNNLGSFLALGLLDFELAIFTLITSGTTNLKGGMNIMIILIFLMSLVRTLTAVGTNVLAGF